jgi:hypothetical protein
MDEMSHDFGWFLVLTTKKICEKHNQQTIKTHAKFVLMV